MFDLRFRISHSPGCVAWIKLDGHVFGMGRRANNVQLVAWRLLLDVHGVKMLPRKVPEVRGAQEQRETGWEDTKEMMMRMPLGEGLTGVIEVEALESKGGLS